MKRRAGVAFYETFERAGREAEAAGGPSRRKVRAVAA